MWSSYVPVFTMPIRLFRSRPNRISSSRSSLQILPGCQKTGHLVQMIFGKSQVRTRSAGRDGTAAAVVLRHIVRKVTVVTIYRIHVDITVVADWRHRHVTFHVALFYEGWSTGMRMDRRCWTHGHVRTTAAGTRTTRTVHFTLIGTLRPRS